MNANERRYAELLALALDDACSDAEREEFARLERENPRLAVGALDAILTHGLLQWQGEDLSDCLKLEQAAHSQDEALRHAALEVSKPSRGFAWAALAAGLLVALGVAAWQFAGIPTTPLQPIAEIVEVHDVVWAARSAALRDGNSVLTGRLENTSGSFTLQFWSGPLVRIAGPTSLDIKSGTLIQLDRGQATARVPEECKDFAIKTPVARVVDLGTEFGVVARQDGKSDVVVFEGRVDVRDMAGPERGSRTLVIGDGARIDDQGTMNRIVRIGRNTTGHWWTDDPEPDKHLITSISDNIVTDVSNKFVCYQTTYGGLEDDALAYADNPNHQWNGLEAEGLPEFLRGADYIKTFNDYRYRQDFELTLLLSKPANLYVFADNRIPPPAWLRELFEDTGVDIGLDEGPWLDQAGQEFRHLDKNTTAVGGGKSIDNAFSVWLRICAEPGPITLGDAGKWATEGRQGRAMYGIAATPFAAAGQ